MHPPHLVNLWSHFVHHAKLIKMQDCDASNSAHRSNVKSSISGSRTNASPTVFISSNTCSSGCSDASTLVVDECDHSIVISMATSDDTFDISPNLVHTANSPSIHAPLIPLTDNDTRRSHSRQYVPLLSARVGSSSTIYRESMKETIKFLFFQLNHQQENVDRYGDMEIVLAR